MDPADTERTVWRTRESRCMTFVLDQDCAVVFELFALCQLEGAEEERSICIGWSLVLPVECPQEYLPWSVEDPLPGRGLVVTNRQFFEGPGYSPSGRRVWVPLNEGLGNEKVRYTLELKGQHFLDWLRKLRPTAKKKTRKPDEISSYEPSLASAKVAPKDLGAALSVKATPKAPEPKNVQSLQQQQQSLQTSSMQQTPLGSGAQRKPQPQSIQTSLQPPDTGFQITAPSPTSQRAGSMSPQNQSRRQQTEDISLVTQPQAPRQTGVSLPTPLGGSLAAAPIKIYVKDEATQYEPLGGPF